MASLIGRSLKSCLWQQNIRSQLLTSSRLFSAQPPVAADPEQIKKLVENQKVVVFMKGNPEAPRCGFSNAVVQIMRMHNVEYSSHDVLQNEDIRQGIKGEL